MITSKAYYYDGSTSARHEVELIFDARNMALSFDAGVACVWEINDVKIEKFDTIIELRHKTKPNQVLKITDEDFIRQFYSVLKSENKLSFYHKLTNQKPPFYIALCLIIVGFLTLAYFYVVPYVAEKSVAVLPKSFDNYIGNVFINNYMKNVDVDSVKTKYLNKFAQEIDFGSTQPLHFIVVESSQINAFALPNGKVVVYTALIEKMQGNDEMAGLLAHEVAHINERHGIKMLMRNLSGYLFISLIFTDINGIMAVLVENAQSLQNLSYSRKFENQADALGVEIMIKNNIDPKGMVRLFSRLKESDIEIPEFLSSHPVTAERQKTIQRIIDAENYSINNNKQLKVLFNNIKNK